MSEPKGEVMVCVRLESDHAEALVRAAKMRGVSKSELLREFAVNSEAIVKFLDEIPTETNKMAWWVVDHVPDDNQPELLDFLTKVMSQAAKIRRHHPKGGRKK